MRFQNSRGIGNLQNYNIEISKSSIMQPSISTEHLNPISNKLRKDMSNRKRRKSKPSSFFVKNRTDGQVSEVSIHKLSRLTIPQSSTGVSKVENSHYLTHFNQQTFPRQQTPNNQHPNITQHIDISHYKSLRQSRDILLKDNSVLLKKLQMRDTMIHNLQQKYNNLREKHYLTLEVLSSVKNLCCVCERSNRLCHSQVVQASGNREKSVNSIHNQRKLASLKLRLERIDFYKILKSPRIPKGNSTKSQ